VASEHWVLVRLQHTTVKPYPEGTITALATLCRALTVEICLISMIEAGIKFSAKPD